VRLSGFDLTARAVRAAIVCATAVFGASSVLAQSAAEPSLKAAFLYNFAKFAEWPGEAIAPGAPLVLCVVGDDMVTDALADIVRERKGDRPEIEVRRLKTDGPVRSCHLLYVADTNLSHCSDVLAAVKGQPVLTVGDAPGFAEAGGVARLYQRDGKMRFVINTVAADRSGLRLSSKLLSLAELVKEERNAAKP
jgi:hypothetical protein